MCGLAAARDINPFGICDMFRMAYHTKRDICLTVSDMPCGTRRGLLVPKEPVLYAHFKKFSLLFAFCVLYYL